MRRNGRRVELQLAPPDCDEDRIVPKDDLLGMLAKLPTIAEQRAVSAAKRKEAS